MAESRMFGVLFTEEGLAQLGAALKDYWTEGPAGKYLSCTEASPDRHYLHVVVQPAVKAANAQEADIYIPHRFVRLVIGTAEHRSVGFVWPQS